MAIKISQKKEDFKIYVEDNNGNYISSDYINKSESSLTTIIPFSIKLNCREKFTLHLDREELKIIIELLNETVKYL